MITSRTFALVRRLAIPASMIALARTAPFSAAQGPGRVPTPIRQSSMTAPTTAPVPVSLEDASHDDRWLGLAPRDVRWSPDGAYIYFRWNQRPATSDLPQGDPWFRTDANGSWTEQLSSQETEMVPGDDLVWNRAGTTSAWSAGNSLYLYRATATPSTRRIATFERPPQHVRFAEKDEALHFMVGESLYRYRLAQRAIDVIAMRVTVDAPSRTPAAVRLAEQQRELSAHVRENDRQRALAGRLAREEPGRAQGIPVAAGSRLEDIQLAPDAKTLTFRVRTPSPSRPPTKYIDYADASGYSKVLDARPKVGEPRDRVRLGILGVDAAVPPESLVVKWVSLPEAGSEGTVPHGPSWSPDGTRAVVQFAGEHAKDVWFASLDVATGRTTLITHDHDDGWIGGPPIQSNYTNPAFFRWLGDGSFVFASERSGWSHLHRVKTDGSVEPLTSGPWEVRDAQLSRNGAKWLLQTGRDSAMADHLYMMSATGGSLTRLTTAGGRNEGVLSPDGSRVALLRSDATSLADLYVRPSAAGGTERRITVSGTDEYMKRKLARPEMVAIQHPDGKPVYAALYRPAKPNAQHAALIHVHGGGYRQFAHLGWNVYGWSGHVGFLNYLLEQGYVVLDFDYRGGAGFGRDYRADVAGAMGGKDVDGAVAAAKWLAHNAGVDSARIGMYGVSYGGFMTLMSQFRYPGIFAAGVSRAPVTDWAHYSDEWTSRILGDPQTDTAAYHRSSPIYYAEGLRDHLLIAHGLVDDNVHFQDTARLVQRLIELGKEFDVMYYPTEPHVVATEASRLDQSKRAAKFFDQYLGGIR